MKRLLIKDYLCFYFLVLNVFIIITGLSTPKGFSIKPTSITHSSFKTVWKKVNGANKYELYLYNSSSQVVQNVETVK